jgi:hypothetical protein
MKPGTGKSVLDGDVTAGKSMELATEMLNEAQRSNGGDVVQEDHSRYQVTLRRPVPTISGPERSSVRRGFIPSTRSMSWLLIRLLSYSIKRTKSFGKARSASM